MRAWYPSHPAPGAPSFPELQAKEQVERVREWMETRPKERPFFLWIHLWDPHAPYTAYEGDERRAGTDDGDPDDVAVDDADVDAILAEASRALPSPLVDRALVRASFAGLRVLPLGDESTVSARRETVFSIGPGGMLSVAGGKLTTYRRIALDALEQRVIGSSRFHGYDEARSEVGIGWTFLARAYWGGKYNGQMKVLMLRHAFRFVNAVVFSVHPQNVRSQRAMEKIGGVRIEPRPHSSGQEMVLYQITAAAFGHRSR